MADWSALVKGFQQGAEFSQNFRRNQQLEKARDLDLEGANYDMEGRRSYRRAHNPDISSQLGANYSDANSAWGGQLPDPFAFKLFDFIKSKVKGKKKKALDTGAVTPTDVVADTAPAPSDEGAQAPAASAPDSSQLNEENDTQGYADGGDVSEEDKIRERARQNRARSPGRVENATQEAAGADTTAAATEVAKKGLLRRAINSGAGRAAGALAAGSAMMEQTDPNYDERIAKRFGWDPYPKDAEGHADPDSFPVYLGKRALGYASDLGDVLTGGLAGNFYQDKQAEAAPAPAPAAAPAPQQAPKPMALPTMTVRARPAARAGVQPASQMIDFANVDIEPSQVPDMKTDDWKKYRAEVMAAAQQTGRPEAVAQANDMVTHMQQQGFLNYAQQGLALQQAGNQKAAMSAYRAAYQYFPNGHDVEFGQFHDPKTGRMSIVGFGRDEKTGKVVPGTSMVMDPERIATLIDNFKNPAAFTAWTKDWRDFAQRERQYQEVTKPLAAAQAQSLTNRSEADILRAENAALKSGQQGNGANLRNAEHVFRQRVEMLGIQDEAQADYLASVMSQVKAANPNVPDNAIVQGIMQAQRDGTLKQRLQQLGIQ